MMNSILKNKQQIIVVNGQSLKLSPIKAGVSQESSLGPLFFLAHIDNLRNKLLSNLKLFAVDSSIQGFIKALLIMPVLWQKKIQFCMGESNHEANIIAARGLWDAVRPLAGRFLCYGGTEIGKNLFCISPKMASFLCQTQFHQLESPLQPSVFPSL